MLSLENTQRNKVYFLLRRLRAGRAWRRGKEEAGVDMFTSTASLSRLDWGRGDTPLPLLSPLSSLNTPLDTGFVAIKLKWIELHFSLSGLVQTLSGGN